MAMTKKRKLLIGGGLLATLLVGAFVLLPMFRDSDKRALEAIGSETSKTGEPIEGVVVKVVPGSAQEIFAKPNWPKPSAPTEPLSLHRFQVGDFGFIRIGDDVRQAAGYGWFDDGKKFWWAKRDGRIRTASFPELKLLREISFDGYRIHQIRPDPEAEQKEPWRKTQREIAELDFRGAVGVGSKLVAMFGAPGYSATNLVDLDLDSLDVTAVNRVPGYYYNIMVFDEETVAIKSDSRLGFYNALSHHTVIHPLANHRGVRTDESGLVISIRDNQSYTVERKNDLVTLKHRPDQSTWHTRSQPPESSARNLSESSSDVRVLVDIAKRVVTVRDGDQLVGFMDGVNMHPEFHPRSQAVLTSISGMGSRMPGVGILELPASNSNPETADASSKISRRLVQATKSSPLATVSLPKLNVRRLNSTVTNDEETQAGFAISELLIQSVVDHVPMNADTVILDEPKLYFDSKTADSNSIACLDLQKNSVDFVIDDAKLCAVTEQFLVIESQSRFLALEKPSLKPVRDLQFSAATRFATGCYRDLLIVDRFDSFSAPAAVDVATGERLIYFSRYGAASNEQQRLEVDPRWFAGERTNRFDGIGRDRRHLAGLAVINASGRKPMELAPTGKWVYSRFGLLEMNWDADWPTVRHSRFAERPQAINNKSPELLTQQFSANSDFAFFPDSHESCHTRSVCSTWPSCSR